jgi:hypothetical protein
VTVHSGSWGGADTNDLRILLQSVERNFFGVFHQAPTDRIEVYPASDFPSIADRRSVQEPARIYLSATGWYWAQFSYQFGHELGHVACNYDRFQTPDGQPHPWMWFQESLCETASLFTLRRMAVTWRKRPPDPRGKEYAPALRDYAQQMMADPQRQLPAGLRLADWYAQNRLILEKDPDNRALNGLVANRLLPLFEAQPRGWQAVRHLPITRGTLREYLQAWSAQTPRKYRPVIRAIAAEFDVAL